MPITHQIVWCVAASCAAISVMYALLWRHYRPNGVFGGRRTETTKAVVAKIIAPTVIGVGFLAVLVLGGYLDQHIGTPTTTVSYDYCNHRPHGRLILVPATDADRYWKCWSTSDQPGR